MITVNSRDEFLLELKKHLPEKSKGVEIGSLYGDFAKKILEIIKPDCLFLVDPYEVDNSKTYGEVLGNLPIAYSTEIDYKNVLNRFKKEINCGQVFVVRAYSHDAVKLVKDGLYDFIYLDGEHLYDAVKKDLNDWLPKLKYGGVLCGHDMVDVFDFGVVEAVGNFINENNFELIIYNTDGGDWAIKRKTK